METNIILAVIIVLMFFITFIIFVIHSSSALLSSTASVLPGIIGGSLFFGFWFFIAYRLYKCPESCYKNEDIKPEGRNE